MKTMTPAEKPLKKRQIAQFISSHGSVSKSEIVSGLHISMPTVLQNIRELLNDGVITESGLYHSTGGRKPKVYTISGNIAYAVGIDITAHHLSLALVNLKRELLHFERYPLIFSTSFDFFKQVHEYFTTFLLKEKVPLSSIVGVGISLPGIVDNTAKQLCRSHILNVQDHSFAPLISLFNIPVYLENDANCAARAELYSAQNAVYLSLSSSVGGAVCLNGNLYCGDKGKAGEFGHVIIEQNGKSCYCGKKGCLDAYCSAKVLQNIADDNLELFFQQLYQKDPVCTMVWDDYLEHIAIAVANMRMCFDCDIILGGYVGGYLADFRLELCNRVKRYNNFDSDTSYLKLGRWKQEASAYGITQYFIDAFFNSLS